MKYLQLLKLKLRRLATVEIDCQPEQESIPGNVLVSGNSKADREAEDWVREQLRKGNVWAWCSVVVRVTWGDFTAEDSLGCNSYESEAQFKIGCYYEDMVNGCLDTLTLRVYDAGIKIGNTK